MVRVAFCASSRSGFGHLSRIRNIAESLRSLRPETQLAVLTNSSEGALEMGRSGLFAGVEVVPRERMATRVQSLEPDLVVVDTAVIPGLHRVSSRLALILRAVRADCLGRFSLEEERPWDLVLVPHPVSEWTPGSGMPPTRNERHSGWILRAHETPEDPPRDSSLRVLVASGGGGTDETVHAFRETVDAFLVEVRGLLVDPVEVTQVRGPHASEAAILKEADHVQGPCPDLPQRFADADLVVSTCGYNSVLELALTSTPALLVPVARSYDDQGGRAREWGERLGMAHNESNASLSALWAAQVLETRFRRDPERLTSGAPDAASALGELLS